ncbi:MAG: thiol reductant ABC exporter subunit CydD, partial [Nocardioides sp.]
GSMLVGLLTIGQAFALGIMLVRLVSDPASTSWWVPAGWLVGILLARAVLALLVDMWSVQAASQVSTALRRRLLSSALAGRGDALAGRSVGEVSLLATRGMAALEPYFTRYLPTLVLAAVLPALTLAAITWQDWLSGLIVLLTIPMVPVFAALIGWATQARADRQWRELGMLSGHFLDVMRGLPTLVAFRRADAQAASIRAITDRYRRATMDTLRLAFASSGALELIATISVALVAVSVGLRLASGSLDFTTAMIVLLLAPEAYWPLRRVGAEFHSAAEGAAALSGAAEVLSDSPVGRQIARLAGETSRAKRKFPAPSGAYGAQGASRSGDAVAPPRLELTELTLSYSGRLSPVVSGLTATIPGRGLTAIVGPSGAGKSTLLAALLGELEPTAGSVRLYAADSPPDAPPDAPPGSSSPTGQDLQDLDPELWRASLAWAPQRPWLMEASIRDNLTVACGDDLTSDGGATADVALLRALDEVGLGDVIGALPRGLDTILGEDGGGLSAGQRARLGLARILVADRPWVFLDEPTAHLDAATEQITLRVLRRLATHAAVVVVAHKPHLIEAADHIIHIPASTSIPPTEPSPSNQRVPGIPAAKPIQPEPPQSAADLLAGRGWRQLGTLLGTLSVASGVALTATASWLITRASEHPPVLMLMVAIVSVRTFGLARPALRYAERLVSHDAALRLLAERRARVYDALVPLVPGRLGRQRGDVLASVVDDVDALVDEQLRVRQPVLSAAGVTVITAGLAALVSPPAAGLVLALGAVAACSWWASRAMARPAQRRMVAARAALSSRVVGLIRDARNIVVWRAEGRALDDIDDIATELGAASRGSVLAASSGHLIIQLAAAAALPVLAVVAPTSAVTPAMLALLVMLPIALLDALLPVADAAVTRARTESAADRVDALIAATPLVTTPETPVATPQAPLTAEATALAGGWGPHPAFTDINFALPPGARLGVVGPSGSGKSTLAALLLRFLDPHSGRLLLNGADLRDLALDDVRRLTGLVDDDPHVFASTLRENLRLARTDADDDALLAALHAAHLDQWLSELPRGLDTHLGDGGQAISGGERARLAIARSLLADQPILVLDEPTAHLDHDTASRLADEVLGRPPATDPASPKAPRSIVWITHATAGLDQVDAVLDLGAAAGEAPSAPALATGTQALGDTR